MWKGDSILPWQQPAGLLSLWIRQPCQQWIGTKSHFRCGIPSSEAFLLPWVAFPRSEDSLLVSWCAMYHLPPSTHSVNGCGWHQHRLWQFDIDYLIICSWTSLKGPWSNYSNIFDLRNKPRSDENEDINFIRVCNNS